MQIPSILGRGATRCALSLCYVLTYMPYPLQRGAAWLLGMCIVLILPRRAAIMRRNLMRCFPEYSVQQRESLFRANRWNMGQGVIESAMALMRSDQYIRQRISVKGFDVLRDYYAKQEAVILLMPHATHMMLLVRICALLLPVCLLRRRQNNPVLDDITVRKCHRYLVDMCTQSDTRKVLKLLRQKQVMMVLPDHDLGPKRSVFAPFFGIQTATITAVSKMAGFADAKVVVAHATRDETGHYHVVFADITAQITRANLQQDAATINAAFEAWIRQHPSQYYWCHRRFKTRPIGEPKFY
jgi:KDO2-lipid IV(A) lauroyltransferase